MSNLNEIAVIGLGVMGANLARNLAGRGFRVAGYDRNPESGLRLNAEHPDAKLAVASSVAELVRGLERPRRIVVLVNAGAPVDAVLDSLDPLLEQGDVVVDAGNSLYTDTERRIARAAERPWRFLGMGISGGAEGALKGPAIMPGGDRASYERLRPLLEAIAARSESGPCVTWCGQGSAGHFVKMVHNGIEYGDMQLIAEIVTLMREGLKLPISEVAAAFSRWNEGELGSYLVEITADILRTSDPERPGGWLLDAILDQAGQKGTGKWTVIAAAELGVAIPTIAAAVDARNLSAARPLRLKAAKVLGERVGELAGISVADLEDALYASKIASYAQGFAMLERASAQKGYQTNLAEVARTWTAGCIIRARFLDRVRRSFQADPQLPMLALAPDFARELERREPAWRRVVAAAAAAGIPAPGLSASLGWFDTLRTSRGGGAVIQAQRDYFGSHTYERVERPGWRSTPIGRAPRGKPSAD
ncbi:MAG: NADP-dependent phosphogluconate dehydrogenase [Deltaproteobacteria bacterium]|nr:NADP-dependent phosphogluconate dehydrogenase [Deltaproteobacteria bacterium]